MKNFIITLLLTISSGMMIAQSQNGPGIFISPIFEISEVNAQNTMSFGFGGGVEFGNFFLGGYHTQTLHAISTVDLTTIRTGEIKGTGLWVGKTIPVNEHKRVLFGAKTAYQTVRVEIPDTRIHDVATSDRFWSISPEAGMEWQLGYDSWLSITAGYKLVGGLDGTILENKDVAGLSLSLSWKLGIWR